MRIRKACTASSVILGMCGFNTMHPFFYKVSYEVSYILHFDSIILMFTDTMPLDCSNSKTVHAGSNPASPALNEKTGIQIITGVSVFFVVINLLL